MLNIAILGLGEGRSTMSAAIQSKKLELVKVCDANKKLCRLRAKEFDFMAYTTNYQELLDICEQSGKKKFLLVKVLGFLSQ